MQSSNHIHMTLESNGIHTGLMFGCPFVCLFILSSQLCFKEKKRVLYIQDLLVGN